MITKKDSLLLLDVPESLIRDFKVLCIGRDISITKAINKTIAAAIEFPNKFEQTIKVKPLEDDNKKKWLLEGLDQHNKLKFKALCTKHKITMKDAIIKIISHYIREHAHEL